MLTSCPSCLQGLARFDDDAGTHADYIVVEMARHLLGADWMPDFVARGERAAGSSGCYSESVCWRGRRGLYARDWNVPSVGQVLSFGEDASGELYVITASAKIYRIAKM